MISFFNLILLVKNPTAGNLDIGQPNTTYCKWQLINRIKDSQAAVRAMIVQTKKKCQLPIGILGILLHHETQK